MEYNKKDLVDHIKRLLEDCFSLPERDRKFIESKYLTHKNKQTELVHIMQQLMAYKKYQDSSAAAETKKEYKVIISKVKRVKFEQIIFAGNARSAKDMATEIVRTLNLDNNEPDEHYLLIGDVLKGEE